MKITLLGTGTSQGVPVIGCDCLVCKSNNSHDKRLRSSVMFEINDQCFVIDTGPDFRQQMLIHNVKDINAVLYTHHHKDHVAGLDDIRAFNHKWKKSIDIYCSSITRDALIREFPYVFDENKYPGVPNLNINTINNKPFIINNVNIIPIEAKHYLMSVFGFRINDFVYLTDVSGISYKEKQKMKDAELIILDALRIKPHISHFNLDEALELLSELKPKKALLTHISHYMGLHNEINQTLPNNVQLAYDGQVIDL